MDKEVKSKVSLDTFLKERGTLLSSIGVMFGFVGILGTIPLTIKPPFPPWPVIIIYIFSLLMMVGALLIWSELIFTFPPNPEPRLRAFKWVLVSTYTLVVIFLSLIYRNLSSLVLPLLV